MTSISQQACGKQYLTLRGIELDSRLVTIDGLGMLLMLYQIFALSFLVGRCFVLTRDQMTFSCVFQ